MSSVVLSGLSSTISGTNVIFTGTYTATFSATAAKLGLVYLPTLTVSYAAEGNPTAQVSVALPSVTAATPPVTTSFSATVSAGAIDPSSGGGAAADLDFKYFTNANISIQLVPDFLTFSGSSGLTI